MEKAFPRSFDSLAAIYEYAEEALAANELDDAVRFPVHLALEELFTNMVKYNPDGEGDIEVSVDASSIGVTVALTEYGVDEFDVTTPRDVDTEAPLDARTPGGLGLYLIQNLVDKLEYQYQDRRSRVIFTKESGKTHV